MPWSLYVHWRRHDESHASLAAGGSAAFSFLGFLRTRVDGGETTADSVLIAPCPGGDE